MTSIDLSDHELRALAADTWLDVPSFDETRERMTRALGWNHSSDYYRGIASMSYRVEEFLRGEIEFFAESAEVLTIAGALYFAFAIVAARRWVETRDAETREKRDAIEESPTGPVH
jgi:hypothetical protein